MAKIEVSQKNARLIVATPSEVKAYLACWLQMGKTLEVDLPQFSRSIRLSRVLSLDGLSSEFEQMWQLVLRYPNRCNISGTEESIGDLLSESWEIDSCVRCGLHVPMPVRVNCDRGACPCNDIPAWPNNETVPPRLAAGMVNPTVATLERVSQRLQDKDM